MLGFLSVEKEFGAETFRIDSTHEYFKSCEYELLTPSELGDRSNPFLGERKKNPDFFSVCETPARASFKLTKMYLPKYDFLKKKNHLKHHG